jgi:hypothetical protein
MVIIYLRPDTRSFPTLCEIISSVKSGNIDNPKLIERFGFLSHPLSVFSRIRAKPHHIMLGIEPYPNPKVSHLRVGFARVSHRAYTTTTDENRHRILTYFLIRYRYRYRFELDQYIFSHWNQMRFSFHIGRGAELDFFYGRHKCLRLSKL